MWTLQRVEEGGTPNRKRKHSGVCSAQLFGVRAD